MCVWLPAGAPAPAGFLKNNYAMLTVINRKSLSKDISLIEVFSPRIATSILPGQYVNVRVTAVHRFVSLPVMEVDSEKGTIGLLVQAVDEATTLMVNNPEVFIFDEITGPHGNPSQLTACHDRELRDSELLFVAGGLGVASAIRQIEWLAKKGCTVDVMLVAPTKEELLLKERFEKICRNVYLATNDGSLGFHGSASDLLGILPMDRINGYDLISTFGPLKMMKQVADFALSHGISATAGFVELLSKFGLTGFRLDVADLTADVAVHGPEFNAHLVDFEHAISRSSINVSKTDASENATRVMEISSRNGGRPVRKHA